MATKGAKGIIMQLEAVIVAAELGSFRKTARVLDMHESALSRQIRALEDELGVSLFQRSPNGVRLTNAGQVCIEHFKLSHRNFSDAVLQAAAAGRAETGIVRLGLYTSIARGFVHDLLETYSSRHPGVSLELLEADFRDLITRVRAQTVDIAFVAQEQQIYGCHSCRLWVERLLFCVQEDDPLAERPEISWSELRDQHFIVRSRASGPQLSAELAKLFEARGYALRLEAQDVSREMLMDLVRMGRGVTLTNEAALGNPFPGIAMIPVENYRLDFHAVWHPDNDNPALRRFLSMARELSGTRYAIPGASA